MYKGYTNVRHRLHAIGMVRALDHYLKLGYTGLISCAESNNLGLIKSSRRMGFMEFDNITLAKIFGRYFIAASPRCRPFGFRIEPVRADESGVFQEPSPRS
ncbi:MAG: hypothetical protein ACI9G5_002370 [Paracoccaceae bacterium]|jgi:hypothetical protein